MNDRCPLFVCNKEPPCPHLYSQNSTRRCPRRLNAWWQCGFLIYTGFQTSYFIGVIGTLTYADDASVVATSLAVLFMNVFVILGSFAGGAALDAWCPRRHFLLSIVGTLATGTAIIAFGSATGVVLLGAVFLGFVIGLPSPLPRPIRPTSPTILSSSKTSTPPSPCSQT